MKHIEVSLTPLPNDENVEIYGVLEFYALVYQGAFNEFDGTGYFMTNARTLTDQLVFENGMINPRPEWATHVVWYAK